MCGIVGLLHHDDKRPHSGLLAGMLAQVRHRGPDATGMFLAGPVGLGHARLSIIDLEHGRQPMQTNDGRFTVAFNGEVFNYLELRDQLSARGCRFHTRSDTEVVLQAYAEYGEECVEHFNGQWALAIWDERRRSLFLSRDRLGIRPLFYADCGDKLLFASEIKALLTCPDVPRELDPHGLKQLFTFWTTLPPTTVFRGVHEVPPGHNVTVQEGRISQRAYWRLEFPEQYEATDGDTCAEQLQELLQDATGIRLRADVPVGAYLSGGLDSAATAALIQQDGQPLQTFSIRFADSEFDESTFQRQLARQFGTEHHELCCSYDDIARVFPDVVWHAERPLLRSAPSPMYLLSGLVRESGMKVVLTGEGADELLGGYDIFKEAKVRRYWARQTESERRAAVLLNLYPYLPHIQKQSLAYRQAFFQVAPDDLNSPFFSHLPRWRLTSQLLRLLNGDFQQRASQCDVYADVAAKLPEEFGKWHPFCQSQYLEAITLLPGYILSSQGDRMSLANGVEGRFPFLDHRLAEFGVRIPPRLKMRGLREKHVLKRAMAGKLPEDILQRTKQPYRAPDATSFFDPATGRSRADYVDELLGDASIRSAGVFHPEAVENLTRKARAGRVIGAKDNMALMGVLSTQLIVRQFLQELPCPASYREETSFPLVDTQGPAAFHSSLPSP